MSSPLIAASAMPRPATIERTMNNIKTFIRPQDHGPRGRARVGLFLALAILFILTTTFNLVFIYSSWGYHGYGWYRHNNNGFIVSMFIQCLCSIIMLLLSATLIREFVTSFIVAILGMCIYIFIEVIAGRGYVWGSKVATWSVLTFWIIFVADAVSNFGFHLTTWLAKKIVEQDTGRIRLVDDVQQQQGQYRDSPSPSPPQETGVVNVETAMPRDDANVDLEGGKQEEQVYA